MTKKIMLNLLGKEFEIDEDKSILESLKEKGSVYKI